ncbi:RNA polymerase factor sigma-54 [Xylocopilactobacillus apicola]|uniref:RNA polymerase sigma-54 factor n=1 Tax=Xylocopilactobacillus apicola TaxID=2932184 RepID=A0AAU9CY51_9LACO|nr:RNA polymerase factor sigma-54 [Xylocopilactobacillus apicola]BDR58964.1 RNA polymerase sigma-54 factor [Xylocopilactobacillus apicola]
MGLKQSYQINQKQLHSLALTQSMKQSILILQTNLIDLSDYAQNVSMSNPLFDVNPMISKREVEMSTTLFNNQQEHQTVYDYLFDQVHLTMRDTPLSVVVLVLIEHLDEHGYLLTKDEDLLQELSIDQVTLMDAKELLYNLDPPGVGAQNLLECLSLQLQFKTATPASTLALKILDNCSNELIEHRWNEISKMLGVTLTEVQSAFKVIQTLTPYPFTENKLQNNYIVPELIVRNHKGKLTLEVTKYGYPNLVFAEETYNELQKSTDLEVQSYVKSKYQEYQALKRNLDRRIQTISMIGRIIIEAQADFFLHHSGPLNPLLLRDVAQKLDISMSTVSRTINGKYLQTDFGVFELKYFFTKRSNPKSDHSVPQVQLKIQTLISKEEAAHPLSDQKLVELLGEAGIKIARRTVAKYREQLGILSSSKRKNDS